MKPDAKLDAMLADREIIADVMGVDSVPPADKTDDFQQDCSSLSLTNPSNGDSAHG